MQITDVGPFIDYFERLRERTLRVARLVPAEHIEWRPRPGAFSFGDLLRHVAGLERWMWAENVRGLPSRYPGNGEELASGREAVLAYLDRLHAESVAIFRSLRPEDLAARCATPAGASLPAWKWLRAMTEHEVHHRGQIYLMLGLLGVPTPPLWGLTAEQVAERSLPAAPGTDAE